MARNGGVIRRDPHGEPNQHKGAEVPPNNATRGVQESDCEHVGQTVLSAQALIEMLRLFRVHGADQQTVLV